MWSRTSYPTVIVANLLVGVLRWRACLVSALEGPIRARARVGTVEPLQQAPDRNLAMDLARVTEAAALAAGRWIGRGDKNAADQAAVDAMRLVLNTVAMDGIVVIGEGEKDEAPMLYNGEEIGAGGPAVRHRGRPDRRHDAHLARPQQRDRGDRRSPSGARCSTPARASTWRRSRSAPRPPTSIDLDAPRHREPRGGRQGQGRAGHATSPPSILDRDRHADIIRECRDAGARIRLIPDGDVAGAIADRVARLRHRHPLRHRRHARRRDRRVRAQGLGGEIQGRLWPRNDEERAPPSTPATTSTGSSRTDDLVAGDDVFFAATGITDGDLVRGRALLRRRRAHPDRS